MAVKIFFCYAREDEQLLNKLKMHLKPLQRQRLIEMWHDRDISAGAEWEREISDRLNAAQVILLLISPDFIASDYCYSIEMRRALVRHERGEARVIPVILRHVHWKETPLGKLQALPKDGKPVTDPVWHNLDIAFYNVAEGIRGEVKKLIAKAKEDRENKLWERDHPSLYSSRSSRSIAQSEARRKAMKEALSQQQNPQDKEK